MFSSSVWGKSRRLVRLSDKLRQIARQCEGQASGCLSQRANGVIRVLPGDEHFLTAASKDPIQVKRSEVRLVKGE